MDLFPELTARLLAWFAANQRDLPWRRNYAPYEVWVSEVMLQQTQMDRALAYYNRWIERFPDLAAVAEAGEDEILKYWEGLGYYSRARNLHAAARKVMAEHQGRFPRELKEIESLPGVGPYTARAVAGLAFLAPVAAVDANVERVLARVLNLDQPVKHHTSRAAILRTAEALVAALRPGQIRDFTQALMEFGALVCSRRPQCRNCPLPDLCAARQAGKEQERPVLGQPKEIVKVVMATGVLLHEGRAFIQKRLPGDVWAGLWEFPGGVLETGETPRQAVVREFHEETGFRVEAGRRIGTVRYGYTKYRVTMHGFFCAFAPGSAREPLLRAASACCWTPLDALDRWAFPAGHRKLQQLLRAGETETLTDC